MNSDDRPENHVRRGPRVPLLHRDDLAPDDRSLLARPIALHRALANSPEVLHRIDMMGRWIRHECPIDPRLRELIILQVALSTENEYEWSHHTGIALDFGVTEQDIHDLQREHRGEPNELGEIEVAALRVARTLTTSLMVTDDDWNTLAQWFAADHLVNLVAIIAFYNQVSRLIAALQPGVEPEWSGWLDRFPML